MELFESLLRHTDHITGLAPAFPAIEAVCDAFKRLYEATVLFEGTKYPTIHMAFPNIHYCMGELQRIIGGGHVFRNDIYEVESSMYTKRLCSALPEELKTVEIRDLWLVGCFLHPFFRSLGFYKDESKRSEYRIRGETLTRKLVESSSMEYSSLFSNPIQVPAIPPPMTLTQSHGKRKFSQLELMDSPSRETVGTDEVAKYLNIEASKFGVQPQWFEQDKFAIIKFWYEKRNQFPKLYKMALRIFATPVSSAGSERVFSVLKKMVPASRSTLSSDIIEDIVVIRSLKDYLQ